METAKSSDLKRMIERVKDLLEAHFTDQLATKYGVLGREKDPVLSLEELVEYELLEDDEERKEFQATREKIVQAIQLDADYLGKWAEAHMWFVDRLVYTFFNRVFAVRVMEELGLLSESTIKPEVDLGNRSARMARIQAENPAGNPDEWLLAVLKDVFAEIGREVKILFEETDASLQVWPTADIIQEVFKALNELDPNLYTAPDAIGWFYHYYVVKFRKGTKTMSGFKSKNPRNPYLLSVLNTVYTPRWMVEFLVDNALGRWWVDTHPDSKLFYDHSFFIHKNPSPDIPLENRPLEELQILDPACGSGNFLIYTVECLVSMYQEEHSDWNLSKILETILGKNIYGIDINRRPAQLATLALFISAKKILREHDLGEFRKFRMPPVNIICCDIRMPEGENKTLFLQRFKKPEQAKIVKDLIKVFNHADEIGSLITMKAFQQEFTQLLDPLTERKSGQYQRLDSDKYWKSKDQLNLADLIDNLIPPEEQNLGLQVFGRETKQAISLARVLMLEYDFIFGNPPFGLLIKRTQDIIRTQFPSSYSDLVSAFIDQSLRLLRLGGWVSFVTDFSFMHLPKFKKFRKKILLTNSYLQNFCVTGQGALPDAGNRPILFILRNFPFNEEFRGCFRFLDRHIDKTIPYNEMIEEIQSDIASINNWNPSTPLPRRWANLRQRRFLKLPRAVIDLTLSEDLEPLLEFFEKYPPLDTSQVYRKKDQKDKLHIARAYQGIATGNNDIFIRYWFEVSPEKIRFAELIEDISEVPDENEKPFVPFSKGGGDIQYYLNNGYVLWWNNYAVIEMQKNNSRLQNIPLLGKSDLHWAVTSGKPRGRFSISQHNFLNSTKTHAIYIKKKELNRFNLLGYLNSKFVFFYGHLLTKQRAWEVGIGARIPIPIDFLQKNQKIGILARESFKLRREWDTGYPMSPIFSGSFLDKILSRSINFHPVTSHPYCEEYKNNNFDTIGDMHKIKVDPFTTTFEQLLDVVENQFGLLVSRLNAIDEEINDILFQLIDKKTQKVLEDMYDKFVGSMKYPMEREHWLLDFLMVNLMEIIRRNQKGFISIKTHNSEGLYNLFLIKLEQKFGRDRKTLQPILRELNEFLGKDLQTWIANDFFFYHSERFGWRPVIWHLTSRQKSNMEAAIDIFVDYHQLSSDTLASIRVDLVEPVLARYQQQADAGLLPDHQTHFPDELQAFTTLLNKFADEGYDEIPSMNALTGNRSAPGKGADQTYAWVAENAAQVIQGGYKPDWMKGVLVNLVPLCLGDAGDARWRSLCPPGTAGKILKKLDALDQLKQVSVK